MFKELNRGIYKKVQLPQFGLQDKGVSPAGAMDLFAYESGNALLSNAPDMPALELIYPPRFMVEEEGFFILTGAKFSKVTLKKDERTIEVPHGSVIKAHAGWTLEFGPREYGFRTYLCWSNRKDSTIEGKERGSFDSIASWRDKDHRIRLIRGPEYKNLENPELFINEGWTITRETSDMGMRLSCGKKQLNLKTTGNMISEAVSDGTVQLTPKGPIVLLKHRQTVGGYPRVFNVISADVDLLAQYAPGQVLHFKEVTMEVAREVARLKNIEINKLRQY
jgi:allophanate hydrolase subunit 2